MDLLGKMNSSCLFLGSLSDVSSTVYFSEHFICSRIMVSPRSLLGELRTLNGLADKHRPTHATFINKENVFRNVCGCFFYKDMVQNTFL